MHIELLWIIPIVAFTFFFFLVFNLSQKKEEDSSDDLKKEVARFNTGLHGVDNLENKKPEDRLGELESAISSVTESISSQQKTIERFKHDNATSTTEMNELKSKLRELYKEYDIVLSENYSLRAKVKKLLQNQETVISEEQAKPVAENPSAPPTAKNNSTPKINLKLYEDTRLLNLTALDDTSEIDLSELK